MNHPLIIVDGRILMDRPLEPPDFVVDTLFAQGLEEQMDTFLAAHPDTVLVIIDTLQMVRPIHDAAYANDYRDLSVLKRLADKHGIAILLIH